MTIRYAEAEPTMSISPSPERGPDLTDSPIRVSRRTSRQCGDSAPPAPDAGAAQAWRLLNRASIEALQGHETLCRGFVAEAGGLSALTHSPALEICADHVLGLLEISLGNFPVAVWQLRRCARRAEANQLLDPFVVRFEPDLVEALLAVGRRREALWAAMVLSVRAERFGSGWARAAVARCRGLLADEERFVTEFDAALVLQRCGHPFDRARTQLLLGERLRRARRRVDARQPLTAALESFRQLGATPWVERATRELDATAMTVRPRCDPTVMDDLTPQEHSVVRMILDGATVREAAGRLFLSPKTVEAHLGRAYRKLGVRNRAQLALRLTRA